MKVILSIFICIVALLTYSDTTASRSAISTILKLFKQGKARPLASPVSLLTPNMSSPTAPRAIRKTFLAREQSEGAGARVRRSVGTPNLRHLTPFLMLDHFTVPQGAGFPDHPHRGQETITYLLQGSVDHEDFAGNAGTIGPGDLQFMTAGRGIVSLP